ncbi:Ccap [Drosophila busckii]|uniref:Ccap n=1 Tax=Drosophila busckii TaxID=30019 RepID=A0A0M3QXI8_DROBS|nr:Ccap [Drosophila busckii]
MRWQIDTPSQRGGGHQHLNFAIQKQFLNALAIRLLQTSMMQSNAKGQAELQVLIAYVMQQLLDLMLLHVQELLGIVIAGHKRNQVQGGETRLATRGDKHYGRLTWRVGAYGLEGGTIHGGHAWTVVFAREAIDVHLQRHRPHRGLEIVQTHALDAQPVGQVLRIGQRSGQAYNAYGVTRM